MVLLDEVEKAHPDVWNIFLQILDEGQITDGKGRLVNMKNTIIIMTSNIGSEHMENMNRAEREKAIRDDLRAYFRIEFLNRIDDIVIYDALTNAEIEQIAELMLHDVKNRLTEQ